MACNGHVITCYYMPLHVLHAITYDDSNEQCVGGLSIDKTIKIHEAAQRVLTSKSANFISNFAQLS